MTSPCQSLQTRLPRNVLCCLTLTLCLSERPLAQRGMTDGQWRHFGSDSGAINYSNLDRIHHDNFAQLQVAWQWSSPENARIKENRRLGSWAFEATPLMIDDVLYVSTSHSDVVALDAATGETIWQFDPGTWKLGRPVNLGFLHRGVTYWEEGEERRIFHATGDGRLIALDAKTGKPIPGFGTNGEVDLKDAPPSDD